MKLPRITANAWRKVALGIVVLAVAMAAFNFVSGYLDFRRELAGMKGVRLNDSREEVMYRLGSPPLVLGPLEPTIIGGRVAGQSRAVLEVGGKVGDVNTMPSNKSVNDYQGWAYGPDSISTYLIVWFDRAGRVEAITCNAQNDHKFACGPLAGMWNNDAEEKVLTLGAPSINSVDGVTKTIEYADIGVSYKLTKGKVVLLELKRPTGGRAAVLHRYVARLLP